MQTRGGGFGNSRRAPWADAPDARFHGVGQRDRAIGAGARGSRRGLVVARRPTLNLVAEIEPRKRDNSALYQSKVAENAYFAQSRVQSSVNLPRLPLAKVADRKGGFSIFNADSHARYT